MPALPAEEAYDLADFVGFLRQLESEGFELAVIGGMAVGAYARLLGETLLSADLDIYVTPETLANVLEWAPRQGFRIIKRPQPRNVQVAFIDYDGKEVNVLVNSSGLPPPDLVVRTARTFVLSEEEGYEISVADPFDLLSNKLAIRREKDLPHIEILRRFVEQETVLAFEEETRPRSRLAPARRLLDVLGQETLPTELAERLVAAAKSPVDYRFLMGRVPTEKLARDLLATVEDAGLRQQLQTIFSHRDFEA